MSNFLIVDCETVAIETAADYLEPANAPANYKDEAKIAAYIEQANREALHKAALDIDLARIVALGTLSETETEPTVWLAQNEADERTILQRFWAQFTAGRTRPTLVGFNCIGYDLPLMVRRSLYLDVPVPRLQIGKYRHDGILDLMLALSFDGLQKYRGLSFYTNRFGIDVPDVALEIGKLVDFFRVAEREVKQAIIGHRRALRKQSETKLYRIGKRSWT